MGAPDTSPVDRPAILLVDDEVGLLHSLRIGLADEFSVDIATSAAEAELMLATRAYAVIVSDHLMPGEEGFAFLNRVRELYPAVRRIMITGYFNPELISRSVAMAELSACLVKPVHAHDLAKTIRAALAS